MHRRDTKAHYRNAKQKKEGDSQWRGARVKCNIGGHQSRDITQGGSVERREGNRVTGRKGPEKEPDNDHQHKEIYCVGCVIVKSGEKTKRPGPVTGCRPSAGEDVT